MLQRSILMGIGMMAIFALGLRFGKTMESRAESKGRVFEIRTYTTEEGKLAALHARFKNHTTKLFEKHGMKNIGYWSPTDAPLSQNTLIYILAHPSREVAKKSWDAFRDDPEWKKVKAKSETGGPLVKKVDSVFAESTDYSPIK